MIRKIIMLLCFICMIVFIGGCSYDKYSGKHIDLYTVAINSILWNNGHSYGANRAVDSKIEIIEQDEYGRIIFTYYERYYAGAKLSFSALVISQYYSGEYVYYYEDFNYIIMKQELFTTKTKDFTEEDLEYLKFLNDWNKEINLKKCIKKNVTNSKSNIPYYSDSIKENIFNEFNLTEKDKNVFIDFLTMNGNGDFIGYGSIIRTDKVDIYFVFLVKINNELLGGIYFLEPSDLYDYNDELINFKNLNGWEVSSTI